MIPVAGPFLVVRGKGGVSVYRISGISRYVCRGITLKILVCCGENFLTCLAPNVIKRYGIENPVHPPVTGIRDG